MNTSFVVQDLAEISTESELIAFQDELVERWLASGAGISDVTAVLKFMELRPAWEFGKPGGLVRFAEKFYRKGYEDRLIESIDRRPTFHTLWMLNRIINGEGDDVLRATYVALLSRSSSREDIDESARSWAREFLERQSSCQ